MRIDTRMHHPDVHHTSADDFREAAAGAMQELGQALSGLLASLPEPVERAIDVERALEVDKKLAWQVFRLARDQTPAEIGRVPASRSVKRLLAAAKRRQVPGAIADRVREAFEGFEAFASAHAGDREVLASMVRGLDPGLDEQEEERLRRTLFRGNAQVWGLRMRQIVRSIIFLPPGSDGAARGEIMLSAHIGLEQMRPDSHAAMISWARPTPLPGEEDTADVSPSFCLHKEFCSRPLPKMRSRPGVRNRVEAELVLPSVGRKGAATLYTSHALTDVQPEAQTRFETNNLFCVPVEHAVFDLLVPAGWTDPATARAACYGRRYHPEHVFERRDEDLLPQSVPIEHLGRFGATSPEVAGAPRHPEAVASVLREAGHADAAFDVYRSRVAYPVLHTMLHLRVDRPARGV